MITSNFFSGKRFLILGLGLTGKATYKALEASGASVLIFDCERAKNPPNNCAMVSDLSTIKNTDVDFVVVSPGIPLASEELRILRREYR